MSELCYDVAGELPVVQKKQLYIAKSGITGAGDGLFASEYIPAGIIIAEYSGDIVCDGDMSSADSDYAFHLGSGISVIGRSDASKINDNVDLGETVASAACDKSAKTQTALIRHSDHPHNCRFVRWGQGEFARVFVRTVADIPPNCELFIDYGKEYWLHRIAGLSREQPNKLKIE